MQDVAPHIAKLKEKHKGDSKMIQSETMRVYKEFGINPAAGCLPILLQLPLIWALYQVLQDIVKYSATQINQVLYSDSLKLAKNWDTTFFGLSLAGSPNHMFKMDLVNTWPILLVPILTGVFQFIQSKMMMAPSPKKEDAKVATKEKKSEDFATAFQSQSLYIFPFMIGFLSFQFPIGLSLYWNTFTIFGIIQQYKISGLGGLEEWIKKWKKK
jgi:YidC/Oxa1 family membrane protein insertase